MLLQKFNLIAVIGEITAECDENYARGLRLFVISGDNRQSN